jgi:hypothetical protein
MRSPLAKWVLRKAKSRLKQPVETALEIAVGFIALAILTVDDRFTRDK